MKNTAYTMKTIAAIAAATMAMSTLAGCGQIAYSGPADQAEPVDTVVTESGKPAEDKKSDGTEIEISSDQLTTKIGSGISSLSKEVADSIFRLRDPYYGKGILKNAKLTSKKVKFYTGAQDDNEKFITKSTTLYFMDKEQSVPYMTLDDLVSAYNTAIAEDTEESHPGSNGMFSLKNMTSSAESTTVYALDANRDGVIDPAVDTLAGLGLDLYCVISDNSFSCGNLTPAAFKAAGNVTLLGQTSGGGACVVQPLMTTDGVMYQISGQSRINIVKNGSYYSVDKGVEPDVYIANNNNLFNDEYIAELIHSIN